MKKTLIALLAAVVAAGTATAVSAWEENAECWYYYSDGTITMGCIQLDGILYYFSTVDPMDPDAIMWTAAAAIEE